MKASIQTLSVLVGILSVVSFIQHLFDIGVFAVAKEALNYYRSIAYFFFGLPARLLGISLPQELIDLWTLSFIGSAAYVKTENIERTRFFRHREYFTSRPYWKFWLFVIFGVSGLGLVVLFSTISPFTYVDEFSEEPLDVLRGAAKNAVLILGGAVVFFLLNAFGPTV